MNAFSYVDSQLRTSKRFDAAGIKAEPPELFEPVEHPVKPAHRSNSVVSSSGASVSSAASSTASDAGTSAPAGADGHLNGNGYASGNGTSSGSASGSWRHHHQQPEGQLRYWAAEMCSRTPHLFDFVVTVSPHPIFEHTCSPLTLSLRYLDSSEETELSSSAPGSFNESCPQSYHFP